MVKEEIINNDNIQMKKKTIKWGIMLSTALVLAACGGEQPKIEETSFETIVVKKQDLTIPVKFSSRLKGKTDVTVMPQINGQLMQICVTEGQQVQGYKLSVFGTAIPYVSLNIRFN